MIIDLRSRLQKLRYLLMRLILRLILSLRLLLWIMINVLNLNKQCKNKITNIGKKVFLWFIHWLKLTTSMIWASATLKLMVVGEVWFTEGRIRWSYLDITSRIRRNSFSSAAVSRNTAKHRNLHWFVVEIWTKVQTKETFWWKRPLQHVMFLSCMF